MKTALFSALALLLTIPLLRAAEPAQTAQSFRKEITRTLALDYLLYLPEGYDEADREKTWPLLLFLHGAGERGNDLALVKKHGPPKLIAEGKKFPFIVVSPQCPEEVWWDAESLAGLLDDLAEKHRVDPDRVYVTGLSMGGFGTWDLAIRNPDRFAAIAPICGGSHVNRAKGIAHLPIWVFHGAQDRAVDIGESERMVAALDKAGNKQVTFTVYPEAGHDSWTESYANPELYTWLLSHTRRKP